MKAREKWGHPPIHHLAVAAVQAPATELIRTRTGSKAAKVQEAISRMANYSSDAA